MRDLQLQQAAGHSHGGSAGLRQNTFGQGDSARVWRQLHIGERTRALEHVRGRERESGALVVSASAQLQAVRDLLRRNRRHMREALRHVVRQRCHDTSRQSDAHRNGRPRE